MSIKLEQYRVFNAVAECGSLSAAASRLYMTQPAVSQTLKQMEEAIGAALFVRTAKGVIPTPEGKTLYSYSSEALKVISNGETKVKNMGELTQGELKIGASDTVSSLYLLPKLDAFHKAYPGIKISVVNLVTSEAAQMVKAGELDVAIGSLPFSDDSLEITPCLTVHDVFVGGAEYKDDAHEYTLKEIAEKPLILLERKSNSRIAVENAFLDAGVRINAAIELGAHELLLQFAQIGLGVSCVTREFSLEYIRSGAVHELKLKEPFAPRAIGWMRRKNFFLPAAAKAFLSKE